MRLLRDIREVLRSLNHSRPKQTYCPRCRSAKIRLSSSLDYWLTPKKYVCEDCGYIGPLVLELEKEENH